MNTLLELCRHKTWATLRLIEHCQSLDGEHLNATMPGTYGTIPGTLWHVVESDEDYFSVLTGESLPEPLPAAPVPLSTLAQRVRRLGPRWEAVARDTDLLDRKATFPDGVGWPGAVLMAQAIHHAGEHRTHILSILGARSLEVPRLDVWAYARLAGLQL
jgi:uncharacterized damage-inducible protein DinB